MSLIKLSVDLLTNDVVKNMKTALRHLKLESESLFVLAHLSG